jgi:arsenical pump membrane protein
MFTSNDVVILTLTPFLIFFAKHSDIDPIPFIIVEFAAANTWSMIFIIGNPTNIYLATSNGIDFLEYFKVMALPTLVAGIVELSILFLIFKKKLSLPIKNSEIENEKLESKTHTVIGLVHLLTCLVLLILSSYIKFEMYLISLACAISIIVISSILRLIRKDNFAPISHTFKRLPYALIPFFLSMYVIVASFIARGVSTAFGDILNKGCEVFTYGYSSFIISNIMNNIPMSIFYETVAASLSGIAKTKAIYASIIGSNLGAILSPLGALAGIMFSSLVRKKGIKFSFLDFFKYGVIVSIPTISATLFTLFIVLNKY